MVDVCNQSDCIIKNPHLEMKGMQEKESVMDMRGRQKNLSHGITNPRDGFFYLSLTPLMDSYYTVGV